MWMVNRSGMVALSLTLNKLCLRRSSISWALMTEGIMRRLYKSLSQWTAILFRILIFRQHHHDPRGSAKAGDCGTSPSKTCCTYRPCRGLFHRTIASDVATSIGRQLGRAGTDAL